MKNLHRAILAVCLVFCLAACGASGSASPTPDVSQLVAATLTALAQQGTSGQIQPSQTFTATFTVMPSFTPTETSAGTPSLTITPTSTRASTSTPLPKPGSISGNIYGYPYGDLPSLTIVAFNQGSTFHWYTITGYGQGSFSMNNYIYPPGNFVVVAYDNADHRGGCVGVVRVVSEQMATCDISDWSSAFPAKPGDVP